MNVKKIKSTRNKNYLEIRWLPSNVCNFRCRYCFPGANEGTHLNPKNLDLICKNFDHLLKQYKEKLGKTDVHLQIIGGEPTLWKDLHKFVYRIKEQNNVYLSLITNGSRTIRWWKKHGHIIDNVHLTHHVEQGDLDHTIQVADLLYEYGKKITVKVLMDPTCWNKCVEAVNYLKKNSQHSWFIVVAEVIEPEVSNLVEIRSADSSDKKYTAEQLKYIKKSIKRMPGPLWFWKNRKLVFDGKLKLFESVATLENGKKFKAKSGTYINEGINSFKGWQCNIGIDSFAINFDGKIEGSCKQRLFGLDQSFNILDENFVNDFDIEFKPAICSRFNCSCAAETHIDKIKL